MGRSYNAEGLVLKRANIGEADRLITFLSKYKGKFTAIAKGVRKVSSRKAPNLELFNYVKIHCAVGKTFDVITEAETIKTHKELKDDLNKVGFGFYLVEITNDFLAPEQGGKGVFDTLKKALDLLDQETNLEKIKLFTAAFEIKFLELLGFKPELYRCVKCGKTLGEAFNFLSPEVGGVVDTGCRANTLFAQPISRNALVALRFLQKEDWSKIQRLTVSESLNSKIEEDLRFYLEYLLEKEIKSARFISTVSRFRERGSAGKLS